MKPFGRDWIYVAVDRDGLFKLGRSNCPKRRALWFYSHLGRGFRMERTWHRPLEDAPVIEAMCHAMLKPYRSGEKSREVYRAPFRKMVETVEAAIEMSAREDYSVLRGTQSRFRLR